MWINDLVKGIDEISVLPVVQESIAKRSTEGMDIFVHVIPVGMVETARMIPMNAEDTIHVKIQELV